MDVHTTIALYDDFDYKILPTNQFKLLISDNFSFFSVKGDTFLNVFTKIFLFGSEEPSNIYPNEKDFNFSDLIKCFEFEDLKNSNTYEKDLGFTSDWSVN